MTVFGNTQNRRGCWSVFDIDGSQGGGARLKLGGEVLAGGFFNPYFVSETSWRQVEAYSMIQCFNDASYMYAFGFDPAASGINVTFTAFLGDNDFDAVAIIHQAYQKGRLSASRAISQLTIGRNTLAGYAVGMTSSAMGAETQLQSFAFTLKPMEIF